MSIRKRTWNGKEAWQVDLLIRGDRVRKQFATKGDAKAFELEARKRAREGTYLAKSDKITLAEIVPLYMEQLNDRLARGAEMGAKTFKVQCAHIGNYIIGNVPIRNGKSRAAFKKGIAHLRLGDITMNRVTEFCEDLERFGKSPKTMREIRNTLCCLLDEARRRNYLTVNPAKGIKMRSSSAKSRRREVTVPPKLLIRMIIASSDPEFGMRVTFAALTGLRASEQWALRWKHIDFGRGLVKVETRLDSFTRTEGITKTAAGMRSVPLAPVLLTALAQRQRETSGSPSDLVFQGAGGNYVTHGSMLQKLKKVYGDAIGTWPVGELQPPEPRWHDLRHFAISCWIEANLAPKVIQTFAGHSSLNMTMDRYGHLFPSGDHHRAMERVGDDVLAGHIPQQPNGTPMTQIGPAED